MKISIMADIHDNLPRLKEALEISKNEGVKQCICCGDISTLEVISLLSDSFEEVYIALGNMDFKLKNQLALFPENIIVDPDLLEIKIDNLKIAVVHFDHKARQLSQKNIYDLIFYGHTHTPWIEKIGKTTLLNPGEITGQFGRATFAIFNTNDMKSKLKLLK
jgi:uncharacterized protein